MLTRAEDKRSEIKGDSQVPLPVKIVISTMNHIIQLIGIKVIKLHSGSQSDAPLRIDVVFKSSAQGRVIIKLIQILRHNLLIRYARLGIGSKFSKQKGCINLLRGEMVPHTHVHMAKSPV